MALRLHIGTHKTATTLLQQFAHRHRGRLHDAGLEYPAWDEWLGIRPHYAHHDLAHAIGDNSAVMGHEGLERFCSMLRERARDHDVLISAEPMYRYLLGGHRGQRKARRAYVERVGEWLHDIDVEVILVCRRPDEFAVSVYGEHVLQTRFAGSLDDFIQRKHHLFDYAWQMRLWRGSVGPVRHLCYESLKREGIVDAFFAQLGIDVGTWKRPDLINRSIDPALVELKRRANASGLAAVNNKRYLRRLRNIPVADVLENERATKPRSLWQSRERERAFLGTSLEQFAASRFWDEAAYRSWRDEPGRKTYMAEWLADMKGTEAASV